MLPPSTGPRPDTQPASGGTESDLGIILTDLKFWYKSTWQELIETPRRFLDLMIDNLPRVQAKQQLLDSAVAQFPTLSMEDKEAQLGVWRTIAKVFGWIGAIIEEVLWEGEVPEGQMPPNVVVAEDWDSVSNFFTRGLSPLAGANREL